MYQVENENAKAIIEIIIPKEILSLKPVIAGGFIVGLYYAAIKYASPVFDFDVKAKIDQFKAWGNSNFAQSLGLDNKVGDIDLWFLNDNPIWNTASPANELVTKDFLKGESPITISDSSLIAYFHLSGCFKSTNWANSFKISNPQQISYPIQFIKKSFISIESLFDNFDLINCCAAYYDGKFYFHDDFISSHLSHTLISGPKFQKGTYLSRIWTMQRCFKYFNRYQLHFSPEICEDAIELFLDILELSKKIIAMAEDKQNLNVKGGTVNGGQATGILQNYGAYPLTAQSTIAVHPLNHVVLPVGGGGGTGIAQMVSINSNTIPVSQLNSLKTAIRSLSNSNSYYNAPYLPDDDIKIDLLSILAEDNPYGKQEKVSLVKLEAMIEGLIKHFPTLIRMKNLNKDRIFLFMNEKDPVILNALQKYFDDEQLTAEMLQQ